MLNEYLMKEISILPKVVASSLILSCECESRLMPLLVIYLSMGLPVVVIY